MISGTGMDGRTPWQSRAVKVVTGVSDLDLGLAHHILLLPSAQRTRPSPLFSRSLEAGPHRQQSQSLLVIHGLPRDKFLGKHIHSAKEGQLEEKAHKVQVPEDQRASLSHSPANLLEMDWHVGPVKASAVVMTEVVSFVHEVHLTHNGHGISEIILRTFRVTESVLDPCGDCVDEIHAEKRNQHEHRPNSPIVNKDSSEVSI